LLEPHLREIQGHITRLEQEHAPFKQLLEAGITGQEVQSLVQWAQNYNADPAKAWLQMGQTLQQQGMIHEDLDYDELTAVATGQPDPSEQAGADQGEVPPWAQGLMDEWSQFKNETAQEKQPRMENAQQRLQQQQVSEIREELKEAGLELPEGEDGDRLVIGHLISNQGNRQGTVQGLMTLSGRQLQDAADNANQPAPTNKELMPKGPPAAKPRQERKASTGGDPFKNANKGAEQMLQQQGAE
jgi:hypothetical protein